MRTFDNGCIASSTLEATAEAARVAGTRLLHIHSNWFRYGLLNSNLTGPSSQL